MRYTVRITDKQSLLDLFDKSKEEDRLYMYGRVTFGFKVNGIKFEVDNDKLTLTLWE